MGLESVFKMCTGAFVTGKRLAFMGLIGKNYKTRCPFCSMQVPETVEHVLLECLRWDIARRVIYYDILGQISGMSTAMASVMLLGGELRAENGANEGPIFVDGAPITLRTTVFLYTIGPVRSEVLRTLRSDLPPRVKARRDTTVLEQGTELTRSGGVPTAGSFSR